MATTALCFTEQRDPASHEVEATEALAKALEGTSALLIAGRRFEAKSADLVHPQRVYRAETDYVIIHPTKGIIVVELKSPRSTNFFTDVYYKTNSIGEQVETTRASEALHQVFRNTLTAMTELSTHIAALEPTLERRFSVSRVKPGIWAAFSNAVTSYVVLYPSLPAGVQSPVGPQGITCIGLDQLTELLTAPDDLEVPYFHAVDLEALEAKMEFKNTVPAAVVNELAALPEPAPRIRRSERLVKAPKTAPRKPVAAINKPTSGSAPTAHKTRPKIPVSPNEPVSVQIAIAEASRAQLLSLVDSLAAQAQKVLTVPQNTALYLPLAALAVEVARSALEVQQGPVAKPTRVAVGAELAVVQAKAAGTH